MIKFIERFLPQYFIDKAKGVDEEEVANLPYHIRCAIIHGSKDEAQQAWSDLRARERVRGKYLLGTAARELMNDYRSFAQQNKNNQG